MIIYLTFNTGICSWSIVIIIDLKRFMWLNLIQKHAPGAYWTSCFYPRLGPTATG